MDRRDTMNARNCNFCPFRLLLSILSILFILSISSIEAVEKKSGVTATVKDITKDEPYRLKIVNYVEKVDSVLLYLSNGTIWKLSYPNLFGKSWFVGDNIELKPRQEGDWWLKNVSYRGFLSADFVGFSNEDNILQVISIDNLGGIIQLSDRSVWKMSLWQRFFSGVRNWHVGDKIIVTPDDEDYFLINDSRGMTFIPVSLVKTGKK